MENKVYLHTCACTCKCIVKEIEINIEKYYRDFSIHPR